MVCQAFWDKIVIVSLVQDLHLWLCMYVYQLCLWGCLHSVLYIVTLFHGHSGHGDQCHEVQWIALHMERDMYRLGKSWRVSLVWDMYCMQQSLLWYAVLYFAGIKMSLLLQVWWDTVYNNLYIICSDIHSPTLQAQRCPYSTEMSLWSTEMSL